MAVPILACGESNKQNLITSGQKTRYADLYTVSINVLLYGIRIFFQEYDSVMLMPNTIHKQYVKYNIFTLNRRDTTNPKKSD
jgi:hypothetical protein